MTPSIHQHGTDYEEYDSQADRWCATMSEQALRRVHPTGGDLPEQYAAAAKRQGCTETVIRHFERVREEQR